jgi:1-acyl-sn-glycerol-3-phosphate acyltransferase
MIIPYIKSVLVLVWSFLCAVSALAVIPINAGGKAFHRNSRMWARVSCAIAGVKVVVEGADKVDFSKRYIFVANHASLFDIPSIVIGLPTQIRIIYKKELERIPVFGWGLKYGKTYISIDRQRGQTAMESLQEAVRKIRGGASVLMFAEGTRSPDGKLQPFKRGAFHLAVAAGVPVVPVAIIGSHEVLPAHSSKTRGGTVRLVLSAPIDPPAPNGKESEIAFMDRVHAVVAQNLKGRKS